MVVCNGASVTTIPNQFNILIKCVVFIRHGNIQALGGSTILMKVAVFKVILNTTNVEIKNAFKVSFRK